MRYWHGISVVALVVLVAVATGGAALRVPSEYETIELGMAAASSGDTVLVAPGVYPEQDISLKSGVSLISESGNPANTVIDAQYFGRVFYGWTDYDVVIRGFTLRNGFSGYERGGGLYLYTCTVTMESCIVQDCTAYNDGGAGYLTSTSAVMRNVEFLRNTTQLGSYDGGALHLNSSDLSIEDALFEDNSCEASGGALYFRGATESEIRSTHFARNSSSQGGAIRCYDASPVFEDVVFVDNTSVPGEGGGIFCGPNCQPHLIRATFIGNSAHRGGALMCRDSGNAEVESALIYENHAVFEGGGLCAYNASPSLQGVTLCSNSADSGGGNVYCANASSWFTATLIAYATTGGGVVSNNTYPLLTCSDVFGNAGGDYVGVPDQTGLVGNISEDPLLCDLSGGNLHVDELSPCAPPNNSCGVLIGARPVGCGVTPVQSISWGAVKAMYR